MVEPSFSSVPAVNPLDSRPSSNLDHPPSATVKKSLNRPKDGARSFLDAVTAYQRRTARPRPERGPGSDEVRNPQAHDRRPVSRLNHLNLADSSSSRAVTNEESFHEPLGTNPESSSSKTRSPAPNRRHQAGLDPNRKPHNSLLQSNGIDHPDKNSFNVAGHSSYRATSTSQFKTTSGANRNPPRNSSGAPSHKPKLFDPNARSTPVSEDNHGNQKQLLAPSKASLTSSQVGESHKVAKDSSRALLHATNDHDHHEVKVSHSSHMAPKGSGASPSSRSIADPHDRSRRPKNFPVRGTAGEPRQLFDPRKHDPVKFATLNRPSNEREQKDSVGLTVNGVSQPSIRSNPGQDADGDSPVHSFEEENNKTNLISLLKQAYKRIVSLETSLREEEFATKAKDEELKARELREGLNSHPVRPNANPASVLRLNTQQKRIEDDYWVRLARQHRELAEAHHQFLEMALDPRLPPSSHALPQKYNTPSRLWQTGFHQLLERLRHALPQPACNQNSDLSGQHLLEHMTDFIYFAYGFYTALLEEQRLLPFRSVWIEQLGDLARYRMAIAGLTSKITSQKKHLAAKSLTLAREATESETSDEEGRVRPRRPRRRHSNPDSDQESQVDLPSSGGLSTPSTDQDINPTPLSPAPVLVKPKILPQHGGASIGVAALGDWEFEEQETWRSTAKDWYAKGLADNPGTGRLHHHLALLSKGDELRTLYHYTKSLTASHSYIPARESILPFFESEHQSRRSRPEVSINDLFVHLHGMLFTKIQLDDFDQELARFMERLTEDRLLSAKQSLNHANSTFTSGGQSSISEASWVMMAVINICALLQYGAEDGVIRRHQQNRPKPLPHGVPNRHVASKSPHKPSTSIAPQAILVNHQPINNTSVLKPYNKVNDFSQDAGSDDGLSSIGNCSEGLHSEHTATPLRATEHNSNSKNDETVKAIVIKQLDTEENDDEGQPIVFTLATKLSFEMLKDVLQQTGRGRLCPYVTLMMTFLGSISRTEKLLKTFERFIPWQQLADFLNRIPDSITVRLPATCADQVHPPGSAAFRLIGFPLLEDWCLRGMEWTGKTLFGRGYWKVNKNLSTNPVGHQSTELPVAQLKLAPGKWNIESEIDVLTGLSGVLEVDCRQPEEEHELTKSRPPIYTDLHSAACRIDLEQQSDHDNSDFEDKTATFSNISPSRIDVRWKRVALVAGWISKSVLGLRYEPTADHGQRFIICKALRQRINHWEIEAKREEQERIILRTHKTGRAKQIAEIDEEIDQRMETDEEEEDDDDPQDNELVKSLKARRRELKALLRRTKPVSSPVRPRQPPTKSSSHKPPQNISRVNALPGYTVLVFDTNILIGMLSIVKDLLESEQYTIIIPLVVITELDGLKKAQTGEGQNAKLSQDALQAITYLEHSIKTKCRWLKIQTSKGNYLRDLSIRNEEINFEGYSSSGAPEPSTNAARNLDDVVLRATMWQLEHFSQRPSASQEHLFTEEKVPEKVILVTLDRNLRLKARARGIAAADEKGIIGLVDSTRPKARLVTTKG